MTTKLTEEQILLGQFYAWLHRRAEYLRKQKEAAALTGQDEIAAAQTNTSAKCRGKRSLPHVQSE